VTEHISSQLWTLAARQCVALFLRDRSPPQFRRVPGLKPYRRLIQDATGTAGVEFIAENDGGRACGSRRLGTPLPNQMVKATERVSRTKSRWPTNFSSLGHGRSRPACSGKAIDLRNNKESLQQYEIEHQPGLSVKAITLISTFGIRKQNGNKHD